MNSLTIEQVTLKLQSPAESRKVIALNGCAHAAVLVPIISGPAGLSLLFTKRTDLVETHKGQISFPGGIVEKNDGSIIDTALRETEEEIGLPRDNIEILGVLGDHRTPTGFVITPVVGLINDLPSLILNDGEVAEVFLVGVDFFSQPQNSRSELRTHDGKSFEVWYYETNGHTIWGATATIIRSLLRKLDIL